MENLPSFFRHAIKAARKSEHTNFRLGAAVLVKGRCISTGWNSFKTHPLIGGPQTLHAEMHAIIKADYSWFYNEPNSIDLVVARLIRGDSDGNRFDEDRISLARPCEDCMEIIKKVGIKKVYFTSEGGYGEINL